MNESFLSFLGLGVSAPRASWGTLVSEGVQGMQLYPWRLLVPAIAMTVFLFAMNFLGDGLRQTPAEPAGALRRHAPDRAGGVRWLSEITSRIRSSMC